MSPPEPAGDRRGSKLDDGYLTISEAAAAYNISRHKIARLIRSGELAAYTNPYDRRYRYIARSDLDILGRSLRPLMPVEIKENEQ
jgi:excisionase family DNA binding protein